MLCCPNSMLKCCSESSGSRGAGKKLTSIASAMGLKTKRSGQLPSSPPSPVLPLHTGLMEPPSPRARELLPSTSSRPTTTHSSWDEPRTPSDAAKHASLTNSVLTTSEMDPFAAQYIPSSASMLESTHRLTVYDDDDDDELDDRPAHDKADFTLSYNRASYTSSSEADHTAPLRFHPHMPDVPDDVGLSPPLLSPPLPSEDDWRYSRCVQVPTTAHHISLNSYTELRPRATRSSGTSPSFRSMR